MRDGPGHGQVPRFLFFLDGSSQPGLFGAFSTDLGGTMTYFPLLEKRLHRFI